MACVHMGPVPHSLLLVPLLFVQEQAKKEKVRGTAAVPPSSFRWYRRIRVGSHA